MGKQHWEFSSTAAQFDGQRLVREASEADAVVLTVTRGNKALQFIRADVYMRRVDAGLQPNGPEGVLEVVGMYPYSAHQYPEVHQGELRARCSTQPPAGINQRWLALSGTRSGKELYKELREAESRHEITSVFILIEDGNDQKTES